MLLSALALWFPLAAGIVADGSLPKGFHDYRLAAERYLACSEGGRTFAAAFSRDRLDDLTGTIRRIDPESAPSASPREWPPALIAAAAVMHTHAAIGLTRGERMAQLFAARRLLSLLRREDPESAIALPWHMTVATLLLASGDIVAAFDHLDRVPDELSDDPSMLLARALASEMAASPMPGWDDRRRLARGLTRAPEWVSAQRRSYRAEAIDGYRNVLERDPENAEAGIRLGFMLLSENNLKAADDVLRAARPNAHDVVLRYYAALLAGRLHEKQGDLARAEREYLAAAALVPHGQAPAVALAHVLVLTGRRAEAAGAARALLARPTGKDAPPRDPWLEYSLGRVWAFQGLMDQLRRGVQTCG